MGIFDKAKDALTEHKDKVEEGLGKAADYADSKTEGKYSGPIDKAEELARGRLDDYAGNDPAADPAATPSVEPTTSTERPA